MTPRLRAALRMACGLLVLGFMTLKLGSAAVLSGLRAVDLTAALAALGIGAATTLASAARWCLVARALGTRLGLRGAVADSYQAQFLNSVLPAGVLGDVQRAARRGVRAVVVERMAGQVVLVGSAVAVLLADAGRRAAFAGALPVVAAVALPVGAAAVAVVLTAPRLRRRTRTALAGTGAALRPDVLGLSAVALSGYVATFVLAARAVGIVAPVTSLVAPLLLALLAMSLPLGVGGWGPRELAAAAGFGAAGLGAAAGLSAAVTYGVLGLVACLPGLAVLAVRGAVTGARRTTSPAPRATPVPSPPTPATAGRPRPTPCTAPAPGAVAGAGRLPAGLPAAA